MQPSCQYALTSKLTQLFNMPKENAEGEQITTLRVQHPEVVTFYVLKREFVTVLAVGLNFDNRNFLWVWEFFCLL